MPLISVIMPVYNTAAYLAESIESILHQTYTDFEFIIVNDGSTDNSEEVIKKYDDPRIRYISNDVNRGYVYCLNKALDLAEGKYVARLDSDDIASHERLAMQFAFMESHPEVIICGGGFEKFGEFNKVDAFRGDFLQSLLTSRFQHSCVFFRNSFFKKHSLRYDEASTYYEDYKLWAEVYVMHGYSSVCFHNLEEVLVKYRVHPFQVSSRFREEQSFGSMLVRRKFFTDFLHYHKIPFSFQDDVRLFASDIISIEKIFRSFSTHPIISKKFTPVALSEFTSLAIYWLYISYGEKSMKMWLRFLLLHGLNKRITPLQKAQVFMHLVNGRKYKRRF